MVQKQVDIGEKQAKREPSALTNSGHISFVRQPRPGHYAIAAGPAWE
jgi:hypothetical protein